MADPTAVLLVPTEAGAALRLTGRCGSSPPMAHRSRRDGSWSSRGDWCDTEESALPLRWDGALVPEGWDRARRVAWGALDWFNESEHAARAAAQLSPDAAKVLALVRAMERGGLCRVVLLDLVDGRLAERSGVSP